MKCGIPELRELRRELRRRGGAPKALLPQRGWTGQQGVFQHIDGRAELPPQSGAKRRLHRVFSHHALLLFSSFLTDYHKSGEKLSIWRTKSEKCGVKLRIKLGRSSGEKRIKLRVPTYHGRRV